MDALKIFILIITSCILLSCDDLLLGEIEENTPANNFELLWEDYDKLYGGFAVKKINWDSLYYVYGKNLGPTSTDRDLYNSIVGLLGHLNDCHVSLVPANSSLERYNSGILGELKSFNDFKLSVIRDNYLKGFEEYSEHIHYGILNSNIGYVHISRMAEDIDLYEDALNVILESFRDTEGVIVDIRSNSGGYDKTSVYISGRFATEEKAAFKFRLKDGPGHNDFTRFYEYSTTPKGGWDEEKKVVVLTHRFTVSAAETFTMAMSRYDHITIVGDTTAGGFSDVIDRELPNGWKYTVSVGDWRDADGKSFEGIGFPPDIVVKNDSADVAHGKDMALETAVKYLKN